MSSFDAQNYYDYFPHMFFLEHLEGECLDLLVFQIQLSDMALPYRYSGANPRPFLVSRGPKITLTFETGIDSSSHDLILRSNPVLDYVGFRASFNFTDQREWWEKPQSYSE